MEIVKRLIIISNREKLELLEIKTGHRLNFFSYTYRVSDRAGENRPVVRWDNLGGSIHFDSFDTNLNLINQQKCEYKSPNEIINLVKIFRHNLANMDINQLM
jgi:hypothetical protein